METSPEIIDYEICKGSLLEFVRRHCWIKDDQTWSKVTPWPEQEDVCELFQNERHVVALKARQLGLTWFAKFRSLQTMLFVPGSTVLLYSKTEGEAIQMLSSIKEIYDRMPSYFKCRRFLKTVENNWKLSNGSQAFAFASTRGDSYTATLVVIDEADVIDNLEHLMDRVKPTVDAGGQILMISRSDKRKPKSLFKEIYKSSRVPGSIWKGIFLPWYIRPDRTKEWYDRECKLQLETRGNLDYIYEQYPSTAEEAMAPNSEDKRFPLEWVNRCYQEMQPIPESMLLGNSELLSFPKGLKVFSLPKPNGKYVCGADPAEGNPNSDESSSVIIELESGEECARFDGQYDVKVFASYCERLCLIYNKASIMPERNNHGHAFILWFDENSRHIRVLNGLDGKPGWLSNARGKATMYDQVAEDLRNGGTVIHDGELWDQLVSLEGATLRAPQGFNDDRSDSFALAIAGRNRTPSWHHYVDGELPTLEMKSIEDIQDARASRIFGMSEPSVRRERQRTTDAPQADSKTKRKSFVGKTIINQRNDGSGGIGGIFGR